MKLSLAAISSPRLEIFGSKENCSCRFSILGQIAPGTGPAKGSRSSASSIFPSRGSSTPKTPGHATLHDQTRLPAAADGCRQTSTAGGTSPEPTRSPPTALPVQFQGGHDFCRHSYCSPFTPRMTRGVEFTTAIAPPAAKRPRRPRPRPEGFPIRQIDSAQSSCSNFTSAATRPLSSFPRSRSQPHEETPPGKSHRL